MIENLLFMTGTLKLTFYLLVLRMIPHSMIQCTNNLVENIASLGNRRGNVVLSIAKIGIPNWITWKWMMNSSEETIKIRLILQLDTLFVYIHTYSICSKRPSLVVGHGVDKSQDFTPYLEKSKQFCSALFQNTSPLEI